MQSKYARQGTRLPRLQHVSIPVTEGAQDAMRNFYGNLIGLREKAVPHTLNALHLVWFVAGDGEMEIHCVPDTHIPHPHEARHICLEVDDLELYRQKLEDAGYQLQETTPIPNRPRFFTTDPCGNRLELTCILDDYDTPPTS